MRAHADVVRVIGDATGVRRGPESRARRSQRDGHCCCVVVFSLSVAGAAQVGPEASVLQTRATVRPR
jgi:hypothetical protein